MGTQTVEPGVSVLDPSGQGKQTDDPDAELKVPRGQLIQATKPAPAYDPAAQMAHSPVASVGPDTGAEPAAHGAPAATANWVGEPVTDIGAYTTGSPPLVTVAKIEPTPFVDGAGKEAAPVREKLVVLTKMMRGAVVAAVTAAKPAIR